MREHRLIHLNESPLKTTLRVCMSVLVGGLRKEGRKEGREERRKAGRPKLEGLEGVSI